MTVLILIQKMLITKQLKKSNNNIRYSIDTHQPNFLKPAGIKVKKNKPVKESQLHKNLSQIPIYHDPHHKENTSGSMANIMMARPYSSLVASDVSPSLSRSRNKKDPNRVPKLFDKDRPDNIKTLTAGKGMQKKASAKKTIPANPDISLISNSKYHSLVPDEFLKKKRLSAVSRSNSKWNNRSVEEDLSAIKSRLVVNRNKYNLSCSDLIKSRSKSRSRDQSRVRKRKSTLNTTKINNFMENTSKNLKEKSPKKKKNQKSKTKFKKVSIGAATKSKGSTGVIQPNSTNKLILNKKEKPQKQNKEAMKKKKKIKSKSKGKNTKSHKPSQMFVFQKSSSEDEVELDSLDGYPINKYLNQRKKSDKNDKKLNIRVGLDYNNSTCLNMVSGSSGGGIYGEMSSEIIGRFGQRKSHILQKIEYENTGSINIQEIKEYELNSSRNRRQHWRINRNRDLISEELGEEYPYLDQKELTFLASIVFIQRSWRQHSMAKHFLMRKNVVTEYFVEDHRLSKEHNSSKLAADLSKDKHSIISQTKVAEFDHPEQEKDVAQQEKEVGESEKDATEKDNQEIIRSDQECYYQTRKNTPPKREENHSPDSPYDFVSQSETGRKQEFEAFEQTVKLEEIPSPRNAKPKTENPQIESSRNYEWLANREVFPEMKYLEYRRNFIRDQFETTMKIISQDFSHEKISGEEFQHKKTQLMESYNFDLENLKKTKSDMKKGYLRFIDCVNKVRESDVTYLNQCGLRKVSSEDNFISVLYEKMYRFDSCISEWSGASQSVELLTKKILIRKQFYKPGSDRSSNKKQRQSLSDLRSVARSSKSSFQILKSSRNMASQSNTMLVFDNTDKINGNEFSDNPVAEDSLNIEQHCVREFRFSNEIFRSKESLVANEFTHSIDMRGRSGVEDGLNELEDARSGVEEQSVRPHLDIERVSILIEQELMVKLARELERDIHEISPALIDMVLIHHDSLGEMEDYEQEFDDYEGLPFMKSLNREFESMTSPRASLDFPDQDMDEQSDAIFYLRQLIDFIKEEQWEEEIVDKMNHNQAFQAMKYLRFLRDFEVPDDEYEPIISNEKFIDWEATFINQYEAKLPRIATREEQDLFKQARAIFHRCIFQAFMGEVEKMRPFGEKGKPFPWETKFSVLYSNEVTGKDLPGIMRKCVKNVEEYMIYRCGVIAEKHFIASEEDLDRMHQENQDRIIEMLEQDLVDSSHQWYELEEHTLQLKLELNYLVEEEILEEMAQFLSLLINPHRV